LHESSPKTPPGRPFTVARLALGNLLVLLGLLALAWAGGEAYYRFVFDSTDSFGLTRVCRRWFQRHYVLNNFGVRDNVNYALECVPGRLRITFLGDSFTAGHGIADVEDRFANRVRQAHSPAWQVHVLAANGVETGAEMKSLASFLQGGYQADVVVQRSEPFLVRHSDFINVLYYRFKAARDPDVADYYSFVRGAYAGPVWKLQQERLRGLKDLCAARGAMLLVVTFPFLHDLGPQYPYAEVHRRLATFWEGEGVPHLDLWPVYAAYAPRDLVIGRFDAHPNVFAHKLAADAIGAFIEQRVSAGRSGAAIR
jgi:hypothetical protein